MTQSSPFSSVEELVAELQAGRQIILLDDEDRENEGDLVMAAQFATAEQINFMAKYGRGLICLTLTSEQAERLDLSLMSQRNGSQHGTNFTVSIEAKTGISTGISAHDRAHTIQTAISPLASRDDIVSPGHVFPLIAKTGGVLVRTGHTEASVDFARLAGLTPAGVICEIMNEDGTMSRLNDLIPFAEKHNLKMGTIASLVEYRTKHDHLVDLKEVSSLDIPYAGTFECRIYHHKIDGSEHIALVKGKISPDKETLVRMHTINSFDDVIGVRSDRYRQLEFALKMIAENGSGVCVILRDPRLNALSSSLAGIKNPKVGGVFRSYGTGAQILLDLAIKDMILLSNTTPDTFPALEGYGLRVVGHKPITME